MITIPAFLLALAILIAVHEYGHYRMAVACGVKVLRFSIGFGPVVWRRQSSASSTEFVLSALPLGGYVRMLDEREAPVAPEERHLAFNTQPLAARALIVAAGPAANLLLAVLLYASVQWMGVMQAAPVLGAPVAGSVAERAGLRAGDRVCAARFADSDDGGFEDTPSFESLRWQLARAALDNRSSVLRMCPVEGHAPREVALDLQGLAQGEIDAALYRRIGLLAPLTQARIGEVMDGGAAQRAGLRPGDEVLAIGDTQVYDGQQLREMIRAQIVDGQGRERMWRLRRDGNDVSLPVRPDVVEDRGEAIGRIGAMVGGEPERVLVQSGPLDALVQGAQKTWEIGLLTLKTLGRMLIGEASLKNISGPITIADYAGKTASVGLLAYLGFLGLISVSLGVLNLLPLPMLDGGHLMYYLWEALTGRPVSDLWLERLQRGGVAAMAVLMSVALFNDLSRLLAS